MYFLILQLTEYKKMFTDVVSVSLTLLLLSYVSTLTLFSYFLIIDNKNFWVVFMLAPGLTLFVIYYCGQKFVDEVIYVLVFLR